MVFALTPPSKKGAPWTKTMLQQFGYGHVHGPNSPLILRDGNIYGTTSTPKGGTVFEMQPPATPGGAWTTTYLHAFTDGELPEGKLIMSKDGTIYGSTFSYSNGKAQGRIYRITRE